MHLIGFKAYRRGYVGCLDDEHAYVYFTFSRGAFKAIQQYPQAQFESRAHFMTFLHKFLPLRFFLRRPFPLPSLENSDLEALGRRLAASLTPDAFLSLQCFVIPGSRRGPRTVSIPEAAAGAAAASGTKRVGDE